MNHLLATVDREVDVLQNPYLVALRDGSLCREHFVTTQVQFCFAVDFFPRPMAAAAARIPTAAARMEVMRNVWEEHGEGHPHRMHGATFREFLRRLDGVTEATVEGCQLWPEVRAFNTVLAGAATLDDYRVSVSVFGMVEHMFQSISRDIGQAVTARGWVAPDQLVHYDLHEVVDARHSEDFFAVVRGDWEAGDPSHRYAISQGCRMGAYVFDQLYRGLFGARARPLQVGADEPEAARG